MEPYYKPFCTSAATQGEDIEQESVGVAVKGVLA